MREGGRGRTRDRQTAAERGGEAGLRERQRHRQRHRERQRQKDKETETETERFEGHGATVTPSSPLHCPTRPFGEPL